jgi:ubiquinone biosynthesis protein
VNSTLRFQRQRLSAKLRQEASLVARILQITRVSLKFLFLVFVADPIRRRITKSGAPTRPVRLRQFFEKIGGSFLKLGQMVALQPDLIPVEFCDELFDLMDRIPPFDYETAERIFHEETGKKLLEVFERVDPTPLATASIGQVYVADLKGEKVAIKLQRPEAESLVTSDVRVSSTLVRFIRALSVKPLYWLLEPLSEFIRWSREELDFQYEGRYTQQALDNARGEQFEKVPTVYWEWTSRRALVIEFLEGITVIDYLRKREDEEFDQSSILPEGYCSADFCNHVVENFLGGAFNCGLFHADLHPGNLMIMKNSTVGYIDFGITGILSDYSRTNLIGLTLAYDQ